MGRAVETNQEQAKLVAEAVTQPLMERMEALEKMLRSGGAGSAAMDTRRYQDMRDAAWSHPGSQLKLIDEEDLTVSQQALLPSAQNFVGTLQQGGPKAITKVVPAASLPSADSSNNAFGNSYHYDPRSGQLSIRAERLENPGEMMLVLAHANAHIRSGNMEDDQSPEFQREFYASLTSLMAQMGSGGGAEGAGGFHVPTSDELSAKTT